MKYFPVLGLILLYFSGVGIYDLRQQLKTSFQDEAKIEAPPVPESWEITFDDTKGVATVTRTHAFIAKVITEAYGVLNFRGGEDVDSDGNTIGFFGSIHTEDKKLFGTFFVSKDENGIIHGKLIFLNQSSIPILFKKLK